MQEVVVSAVMAAVAAATITFNSTSQKREFFIPLNFLTQKVSPRRAHFLRFGLLLHHGVQRQLFYLGTLQELLRAVAGSVLGALRHEHHVQTLDVLGHDPSTRCRS